MGENATLDIYRRKLVQLCKYYFAKRVLPFAKLFDMDVRMDITNNFCKMSCPFMFKIQRKQRFYVVLINISKGGNLILFKKFELQTDRKDNKKE